MEGCKMTDPHPYQDLNKNETAMSFSTKVISGTYAFRFDGFTITSNILFRLLGLGQFRIDEDGTLVGRQRSSITALQGQGAKHQNGAYDLNGNVTLESDGTGSAKIKFTNTAGDGLDVIGDFYVVVAGTANRLWFISSGETLPSLGGVPADELVSLEAVRMRYS
jgi:hypothetical protein